MSVTRRTALKAIGAGTAGVWLAPTVMSMTSVATAQSAAGPSCPDSGLDNCGPTTCASGALNYFGKPCTNPGGVSDCGYIQVWAPGGGGGCACAQNQFPFLSTYCGPGLPPCPSGSVCTPFCPDTLTETCSFFCAPLC
jgi:hypothetical protein